MNVQSDFVIIYYKNEAKKNLKTNEREEELWDYLR